MADNRDAILKGTKAAYGLHRDLGIRQQLEHTAVTRVDVFGAITKLGAALVFQPLDKLLGAYVPEDGPGVLITSQRSLPLQRFTAAHELGHLRMRHKPSLDDEGILRRAPFSSKIQGAQQEREADAFAATFLVPPWLVALLMDRQKWTRTQLAQPIFVYQASLRLGTSYEATCYALERHKVITQAQRVALLRIEPKEIKRELLDDHELEEWRSDVWLLTDRDEGVLVEGGQNDLFILQLKEHSSSGYLWSFDDLKAAGFAVISDRRANTDPEKVGAILTRRFTVRSGQRANGKLTIQERRPWRPGDALSEFSLQYDLRGPETPGMWEPERRRLFQAA